MILYGVRDVMLRTWSTVGSLLVLLIDQPLLIICSPFDQHQDAQGIVFLPVSGLMRLKLPSCPSPFRPQAFQLEKIYVLPVL